MRHSILTLTLSSSFLTALSGCAVSPEDSTAGTTGMMFEADAKSRPCANPAVYYRDQDQDGFGTNRIIRMSCTPLRGYSLVGGDCSDRSAARFPGAVEVCDGLDNDCDGSVDDNVADMTEWFVDADGDGYGDAGQMIESCAQPAGMVANGLDCQDAAGDVYPGANESCDGIDNDCSGLIDDNATDAAQWFIDADGDGYGDSAQMVWSCTQPAGRVSAGLDCSDGEASVYPGAVEVCDGVDNDCSGLVDDNAVDATAWFPDADSDGYGDPAQKTMSCARPAAMIANGLDCLDSDAFVNPGADEICDGVDNDCSGGVDNDAVDSEKYYADKDGDGFGNPDVTTIVRSCSFPASYTTNALDCDDNDAATPLYVDVAGQSGASGSLTDPLASIQEAVSLAGSCVVVGSGSFYEDLDLSSYTGQITSVAGSSFTTIEGSASGPVVRMDNANLTISGFTIQNGGAGDWDYSYASDGSCTAALSALGGALYLADSALELNDMLLRENDIRAHTSPDPTCTTALYTTGGGIYAERSEIVFSELFMQDNRAEEASSMALYDTLIEGSRLAISATGGLRYGVTDIMQIGGELDLTNVMLMGAASYALSADAPVTMSQVMVAGYLGGLISLQPGTIRNALMMDNGTALDGDWNAEYSVFYNNGADGLLSLTAPGLVWSDPMLMQWTNDIDSSNDNCLPQPSSPLRDAGDPSLSDADGSLSDIGFYGGPMGW